VTHRVGVLLFDPPPFVRDLLSDARLGTEAALPSSARRQPRNILALRLARNRRPQPRGGAPPPREAHLTRFDKPYPGRASPARRQASLCSRRAPCAIRTATPVRHPLPNRAGIRIAPPAARRLALRPGRPWSESGPPSPCRASPAQSPSPSLRVMILSPARASLGQAAAARDPPRGRTPAAAVPRIFAATPSDHAPARRYSGLTNHNALWFASPAHRTRLTRVRSLQVGPKS